MFSNNENGIPYRGSMHEAAENNCFETLNFLIARYGTSDTCDSNFETPLHRVCRNLTTPDDVTTVKILVEHGADFLCPDRNGIPPAFYFCTTQDQSIVDYFLTKLEDVNMPLNSDLDTALHIAVRSGIKQTVLKLLKKKPDVNRRNKEGDTSVHVAVSLNSYQLLKDLIENGGDINALGNYNLSPLHLVGKTRSRKCLDAVLELGPLINQRDSKGHTPLMFFLKFHHQKTDMITALLNNGGDPAITDTFGYNCLHYISSNNRFPVQKLDQLTRLFIESGIDIDYQFSNSHESALHMAVSRRIPIMVYTLLKHNANLKKPNGDGETPLDTAINTDSTSVVEEILSFIAISGELPEKFLLESHEMEELSNMNFLYQKYMNELDVLKVTPVEKHGLTYHDLLTFSIRTITKCLNRNVLLESFDNLNSNHYPCLYRRYISHRLRDAKKYRGASKGVYQFLCGIFATPSIGLPDLVVDKITHSLGFYEVLRLDRILNVEAGTYPNISF